MKIVVPSVNLLWITKEPEKMIELSGRTCYKSEDQITDESAGKFVKMLTKSGHHAMIEHAVASFRIITDRAITHEIVRHRLASYCLSGDTEVVAYRHPSASARSQKKWSAQQLYNWQSDPKRKGRLKLIRLRSVDKNDCLVPGKIKKIISSGIQETFEVITRSGHKIKATEGHRFLTNKGYKRLRELSVGSRVIVNGGYAGMHSPEGIETLRKIHIGPLNSMWKGENLTRSGGYARVNREIIPGTCWGCGTSNNVERHHIDEDPSNPNRNNILFLCQQCHKAFHYGPGVLKVFLDKIISITPHALEQTYDIEMAESPHNFIANGLAVHNSQESTRYCNYSKDKYDNECTFIQPPDLNYEQTQRWRNACIAAEAYYFDMLKAGCSPQIAKSVLPNCLKTEIVMMANLREWRHFIKLRGSQAAHPQIRTVAYGVWLILNEHAPNVFGDLSPLSK